MCQAQELHFADSIRAYDHHRIAINAKGAQVMAYWGIGNAAIGAAGYLVAKDDSWKYFHGTNAAYGLVIAGLAWRGFAKARAQAKKEKNKNEAYGLYVVDKRQCYLNIGIDLGLALGGALLANHAQNALTDKKVYQGVGTALALQSIFRVGFDNIMLFSHIKYSHRWAQIMEEMSFTGNEFSYTHRF
jgi:hypothetical protein